MKRGQAIQAFTLVAGLVFLFFVFAILPSIQTFASQTVSNNPGLPTETQYLVLALPFLLGLVFVFGVVAASGRQTVGGF